MQTPLLAAVIVIGLLAAACAVLAAAFLRASRTSGSGVDALAKDLERLEKALRDESARGRQEMNQGSLQSRKELTDAVDRMRQGVEDKLKSIQDDNTKKLEHIRQTVDEKLHETLERRLGESFLQVSQRLDQVHKGLGEMQMLAQGVGDLKRVLTNVKTRGLTGENQLANLLEDLLTPDQYDKNVATKKGSKDRVDYVLRLSDCLLPIDAKFPLECYERMQKCAEAGDLAGVEIHKKELTAKVRDEARSIHEKYIDPPNTTDYAILFVPFESVYAEIVSTPGLHQQLQNDHQVTVAGPTNLGVILNGYRMGFRATAIQKRSAEVWTLLGTIKNEFGNFAKILDRVQERLEQATDTLADASKKTRTIEKKLKSVEGLPADTKLLADEAGEDEPPLFQEPKNGKDKT